MINIYKNIQGEKANSENQNLKYYHEYCNIFVANVILLEKVKQTIDQKEELIFTLKRLQVSPPWGRLTLLELSGAGPVFTFS